MWTYFCQQAEDTKFFFCPVQVLEKILSYLWRDFLSQEAKKIWGGKYENSRTMPGVIGVHDRVVFTYFATDD